MNRIFNNKNEVTGSFPGIVKLLLVLSLIAFFIPLFILPFFNHAGADDYMCAIHLRKYGFAGYQSYIYKFWGGRYAATFAGAVYALNGFLYNHYYLHSLLLIVLNIVSSVFVLNAVNTHILKESFLKKNLVLLALIFTALEITVLAQPSTYIFWFSSAVTYQLPVILIECQIGLWVLLIRSKKSGTKALAYVLIPLLVIIINGFNELFVAAEFFMMSFVFAFGLHKQLPKTFIWLTVMLYTISAMIVLLSPGIQSRAANVLPKGIAIGAIVWGYHVAEVAWNIFRQPLFWLTAVAVFFAGNYFRQKNIDAFTLFIYSKRKRLLLLSVAMFVAITVAIPVTGLKGGVIPERYLNAVIEITVILLLMLVFIAGAGIKEKISLFFFNAKRVVMILFCLLILANNYIVEAYRNIIAAPLYNSIMNEREATLRNSAMTNKIAHLKSYNTSLQEHLQKEYSQSTQTWLTLIQEKPTLLFFQDDLNLEKNYPTLKEYYQLDSLIIK